MRKLKREELGRVSVDEFKNSSRIPFVLVLDNIRSMQNVGSLFRSADAFAVEKIYLCGITGCPPHREIEKSALGATRTVEWIYMKNVEDAVLELKGLGYKMVALEQTDQSISIHQIGDRISNNEPIAMILGNEIDGVSDVCLPHLDFAVEIPQRGTKHSLNVSVAGGIALFALSSLY